MNIKYPSDASLSIDKYISLSIDSMLNLNELTDFSSLWSRFSTLASESYEVDREASRVYWLIADVSSLVLRSDKNIKPYEPMVKMQNRGTISPDFFSEVELDFLDCVAARTTNDFLKARLKDLLWIYKRPKSFANAIAAVQSYTCLQPNKENWFCNNEILWSRACKLCLSIGTSGRSELQRIKDTLISEFINSSFDSDAYQSGIFEVLVDHHLYDPQADGNVLLERLIELGQRSLDAAKYHIARLYWSHGQLILKKLGREKDHASLGCKIASSWESQSENAESTFARHTAIDGAIKAYRKIPNRYRVFDDVNAILERLTVHLAQLGAAVVMEIPTHSTPSEDVSNLVSEVENSVSGLSLSAALRNLALVCDFRDPVAEREKARQSLQNNLLHNLFSTVHMGSDGRVVAKSGEGYGEDSSIEQRMLDHYVLVSEITSQISIVPALRVINQQHGITFSYLLDLCRRSAFVPPGREITCAKALLAGFDFDFRSAIYLICPQVEHAVRVIFKRHGLITTTTSVDDGIQNENGMSTLMNHPRAAEILDGAVWYELRSLFCLSPGPNLRNEVAHGLLSDHDAISLHSVYAWWLFFRLIFLCAKPSDEVNSHTDIDNSIQAQSQ